MHQLHLYQQMTMVQDSHVSFGQCRKAGRANPQDGGFPSNTTPRKCSSKKLKETWEHFSSNTRTRTHVHTRTHTHTHTPSKRYGKTLRNHNERTYVHPENRDRQNILGVPSSSLLGPLLSPGYFQLSIGHFVWKPLCYHSRDLYLQGD